MGIQKDTVRFNVGGKIFQTTATTLANAGRNSFFGAILDDNWNLQSDNSGEYIIDRNPDCFGILLDLLRTGELHIPSNIPKKLLYREALFYGLLDQVRSSKWGQFDGNRLRHSGSITGRSPGDGTAIRAAPDGGCCVAHGSIVHVYDWMLEEHPPLNLDYQRVNDIGWIDSEKLVVTTCEQLSRRHRGGGVGGGMGLFGAATGELRQRFEVSHEGQVKSYTAGALSFSPNGHIFCSCRGRGNEYGIGVWDQESGKQIDFYYEPPGWSLGEADKVQYLNATNCLMVSTLYPRKDNCYISLLDFRSKSMVWSWCDVGCEEKRVRDAVAMEEARSICVVNEYGDLGFMDLRRNLGSVKWRSSGGLVQRKIYACDETCYPKLGFFEGQLFSSMNDSVSVFCGPDLVLTSSLRRSYGGSICDFSIGGDRLFALHSEENVFDVWESPAPPIIS